LCFHFHTEALGIYLAGTTQGVIHMCSYSNRDNSLETFQKHSRPVSSVAWSPFSPDLFLSGSSDGTVQLWRRDSPTPVLGFSSSETTVFMVRWSPKWPTVFAALKAEQLEIWDLKTSTLDPTVVLIAPESAELTSVQFCPDTDAVVLGDSHGEVKVHQLQNLSLSHNGQVTIRLLPPIFTGGDE
uniref:Dynein axonemal intermediate chain 4 n=1 Tax=Neogobius melanostomus TaxID=47308 RepID=A0A8C6S179_9GOBI